MNLLEEGASNLSFGEIKVSSIVSNTDGEGDLIMIHSDPELQNTVNDKTWNIQELKTGKVMWGKVNVYLNSFSIFSEEKDAVFCWQLS